MSATGCTLFHSGPNETSLDPAALAATQVSLALEEAVNAERQGQSTKAIRYYEQVQDLTPELAWVNRRLAILYDRSGDDVRAEKAYNDALARQPRDAALLNDLGVFYLHREKWDLAENWFRRSLDASPENALAANNLAMCLAMQGQLRESLRTFTQIVGPAAAHSNLGVLLARQGRTAEAQFHFKEALALDATLRPAGEFLRQMRYIREEPSWPTLDASTDERKGAGLGVPVSH
jgi:Flp pilus assembly protein TadD